MTRCSARQAKETVNVRLRAHAAKAEDVSDGCSVKSSIYSLGSVESRGNIMKLLYRNTPLISSAHSFRTFW